VGTFDFMLNAKTNSGWYDRLVSFYKANGGNAPVERRPAEPSSELPQPKQKILFDDEL
jgi:hypothetical protein